MGAGGGDSKHGQAEALFLEQLETIEHAIRFACRRSAVQQDDQADFASYVKLKLIENDYAVIAKYERRATFSAFIAVVVQRMLLDYRIAQWGKWHASAKAQRIGEPAITIEAMLVRDGRTVEEIVPVLRRRWPDLTRARVEGIVSVLPHRNLRPRAVELDPDGMDLTSTDAEVDAMILGAERRALTVTIQRVVRDAMAELEELDRAVLRLHFEGGMSIAEISRTLRVEQKPLYRRLQRGLTALRVRLEAAGITAVEAEEVLSTHQSELDFGFPPTLSAPEGTGKEDS